LPARRRRGRSQRGGVVLDPNYAAADGTLKALPSAVRGLGLEARVYEARSAQRAMACRLFTCQKPLIPTRRSEIATAAANLGLPAIYTFREFVQAGGLPARKISRRRLIDDLLQPFRFRVIPRDARALCFFA
jgi:hypothetical protein